MMKILKKGILPKDKTYTVSCGNCHTKFQFKQHEGEIIEDDRDGDYITIKCPICKGHVNTSI